MLRKRRHPTRTIINRSTAIPRRIGRFFCDPENNIEGDLHGAEDLCGDP